MRNDFHLLLIVAGHNHVDDKCHHHRRRAEHEERGALCPVPNGIGSLERASILGVEDSVPCTGGGGNLLLRSERKALSGISPSLDPLFP